MICLLSLGLLASIAFGNDSLRCRMIDWLDAPTNRNFLHEPVNDTWPAGYNYCGTGHWDLAMGDSFMVWLPGSQRILFLDAYETSEVDTIANFKFLLTTSNACAAEWKDSIIYLGGGGAFLAYVYDVDSLRLKDGTGAPGASYHFAALEDSFLYTDGGSTGLTRINVANPESIFIDKTYEYGYTSVDLVVKNQRAYCFTTYSDWDYDAGTAWPVFESQSVDFSPLVPVGGRYTFENRFFGGATIVGVGLVTANSYMSDYPDWEIGQSYLYSGVTSVIYTFESHWDGQALFSIENLNDNLLCAGFEHGISVLNYQRLDSIYEVAYYMDSDSTMDITHLAMKESRIYAMGHPRDGYVRLYMFDVGDSVETGQCEAQELPTEFRFWNYPNPFNSSVRFAMDFVPEGIEIYDMNGRLVEYIHVTEGHQTLPYEVMWNPHDLSSGIYFARIQSGKDIYTTKLIYLQ